MCFPRNALPRSNPQESSEPPLVTLKDGHTYCVKQHPAPNARAHHLGHPSQSFVRMICYSPEFVSRHQPSARCTVHQDPASEHILDHEREQPFKGRGLSRLCLELELLRGNFVDSNFSETRLRRGRTRTSGEHVLTSVVWPTVLWTDAFVIG